MSLKAVCWAVDQEGLKPAEKVVLIQLCNSANEDTFDGSEGTYTARIRQSTLARKVTLSQRTTNKTLAALEEMGFITTVQRYNDAGAQLSNDYKVNAGVKVAQILQKKPAKTEQETSGLGGAESAGGGVKNCVPGVSKTAYRGGQKLHTYKTGFLETGFMETEETATPAQDQNQKPEEQKTDSEKFRMHAAWQVDPKSFSAYCKIAGLDATTITDAEKLEFARYWSGEDVQKTQEQWENRFLKSLKYSRAQQPPGQPPQPQQADNLSDAEREQRDKTRNLQRQEREIRQEIQHLRGLINQTPGHAQDALREQLNALDARLIELRAGLSMRGVSNE